MDDLADLRWLSDAPHPGLDGLEGRVLARLEQPVSGRTPWATVAPAALALGVLGGAISGASRPAIAATPFGVTPSLAASTLLLGR